MNDLEEVCDRIRNGYLVMRFDLEEKIKSFVPSGPDKEESESQGLILYSVTTSIWL